MKTLISALVLMAGICFTNATFAQCAPGDETLDITNNTSCDFHYDIHLSTGNYQGTISANSTVQLCVTIGDAVSMYVQPIGGGTDNTIDGTNSFKTGTDCSGPYQVHGLGWTGTPHALALHIDD